MDRKKKGIARKDKKLCPLGVTEAYLKTKGSWSNLNLGGELGLGMEVKKIYIQESQAKELYVKLLVVNR